MGEGGRESGPLFCAAKPFPGTRREFPVFDDRHRERLIGGCVIFVLLLFLVAPFETGREKVGRIGTDLTAKQIERITKPEVDVLLNNVERYAAQLTYIAFFH